MKKILPVAFFVLIFSGFLSWQILWDTFTLNAKHQEASKANFVAIENLFQSLKVVTTEKNPLDIASIKTPVVIVNFWASWCSPCLREFPSLVEMQTKFKDKVTIIAVNGDEEDQEKNIQKIQAQYKLNFHQVADKKGDLNDKFFVTQYPYSLVFKNKKLVKIINTRHEFMDSEFLRSLDLK